MRFVVLLVFFVAQISTAVVWITYASWSQEAAVYYGVSIDAINGLSVVFMAAYLPGTVLSAWVYNKFSLRSGLILATFVNSVGAWIRVAPTFGAVMLGQVLCALVQPFFTNAPAKIASRWFPVSSRGLATAVGAMANPVGIGIGQVLPSVFVSTVNNTLVPTSPAQVLGASDLAICEAGIATAAFVLVLALLRNRPPTPPSASQEGVADEADKAEPFGAVAARTWRFVVDCFSSRDFAILFLVFGAGLGIFNAISTLVQQMTSPACSTSDDASLYGGVLLGVGVCSAIAVGVALDRTHNYRLGLRVGFGGGAVLLLILTLVIQPGNMNVIAAFFALLGLVVIPMLPCSFEAAVEATYPVPEDISNGLLMMAGNYAGIALIYIMSAFLNSVDWCAQSASGGFLYPGSSIVVVVVMALAASLIFLFRGELKRFNVEGGKPLIAEGQQ